MLLQRFHPFKQSIISVWWREILLALFFLMAIFVGASPVNLFSQPPDIRFFEMYIKDGLLPVTIACILWFVQLTKANPTLVQEFKFLNSLPLSSFQLALHLYAGHFMRNVWVPLVTIVLLFSLAPYAPISHILRVGAAMLLLYGVLLLLMIVAHFISKSSRYNALSTMNPVFVFIAVFLFVVFGMLIVLQYSAFSGLSFWIIIFTALSVIAALFLIYINRVETWQGHNQLYHSAVQRYARTSSLWRRWLWHLPPLLIKNFMRIEREKSRFTTILTAIFILCGYLVSRNNQRVDDFNAIMNAAVIGYAILFSYKYQNMFSTDMEPRRFIYALPVRRSDVYLATLIPALIWVIIISFIFSLLTLRAHAELLTSLFFWLKSGSVSAGFVVVAVNFAFAAYPEKTASKYFLYWGLAFLVMFALFYAYRYPVFFSLVVLSFFSVKNKRFYR